ncbi:MAG: RNA methyltransferase [Deltaproteobacteria bacterium]|nr:RNA methyltransferase [Deltaproteobacteria bacterium]
MRRTTAGVVPGKDLLPALIARVERHDARRVVRLLEPLVLDRRAERLREVIDQRLSSVQVVFDAPHDPHNGAAVLRTCEAFGVQFIHVVERKEKFLAAPSVSRGSEKWVDVQRWSNVPDVVAEMRARGLVLVGAHPEGELSPADLAAIPSFALVLGNERDGITEELAAACEKRVRVPMRGFVESLNVSVTAAILLAQATFGRKGDLSEEDRIRLYARGLYLTVDKADEVLRDMP